MKIEIIKDDAKRLPCMKTFVIEKECQVIMAELNQKHENGFYKYGCYYSINVVREIAYAVFAALAKQEEGYLKSVYDNYFSNEDYRTPVLEVFEKHLNSIIENELGGNNADNFESVSYKVDSDCGMLITVNCYGYESRIKYLNLKTVLHLELKKFGYEVSTKVIEDIVFRYSRLTMDDIKKREKITTVISMFEGHPRYDEILNMLENTLKDVIGTNLLDNTKITIMKRFGDHFYLQHNCNFGRIE